VTAVLSGMPFIAPGTTTAPFVWVEDAAAGHAAAIAALLFPPPPPASGPPRPRPGGRAYHLAHDPVADPFLHREWAGGPVASEAELRAATGFARGGDARVAAAEAAEGCAGAPPPGVNAYGMAAAWGLPLRLLRALAAVNAAAGRYLGLPLINAQLTPVNCLYLANRWPCTQRRGAAAGGRRVSAGAHPCALAHPVARPLAALPPFPPLSYALEVADAAALLGWRPTPWRVVAARLGRAAAAGELVPGARRRYRLALPEEEGAGEAGAGGGGKRKAE
jgi:hypothetical protein